MLERQRVEECTWLLNCKRIVPFQDGDSHAAKYLAFFHRNNSISNSFALSFWDLGPMSRFFKYFRRKNLAFLTQK
jgi:hypothetical protein